MGCNSEENGQMLTDGQLNKSQHTQITLAIKMGKNRLKNPYIPTLQDSRFLVHKGND